MLTYQSSKVVVLLPFAGDLVLVEAPVAAVVRSQFVKTVCHTCYRELPALARPGSVPDQAAAAPNKQYCSRACALADTLAAVTNPIHAKIDKMAVKTQVHAQSVSCSYWVYFVCMP